MTSTAIVAISRRGAALARILAQALPGDVTLYLDRRHVAEVTPVSHPQTVAFDLPLRPVVQHAFREHQRLVLFLPVGAAVRLLAPCLEDKHQDPAVVCVDDAGRFAVSLLSGHLGGADRLAQEVARALGAVPVITSASHVTGTLAVDLLGQEWGWRLEADPLAVTRASAAVVNGDPVGIWQQTGESHWWPQGTPLPANLRVYPTVQALAESPSVAALVITDQLGVVDNGPRRGGFQTRPVQDVLPGKHLVVYRPRSLVAGMGCRRGVPVDELEELLADTFQCHNLSLACLRSIATAELKGNEPGLLALAQRHGVPLVCYGAEELNRAFEDSAGAGVTPSAARRLLGVWGVAEPAALLASGGGELLVPRQKAARATIAVARVAFA
ncbi:MAG: cobalamin biosynthesis protein CbiG [Dehalococcoidia bacterium]|nr:cobalamin biosynthesis protein CbiG [Dehalococcoidia bacterium]MSQ16077.1 cobalamin biosynthesis protein CbiG [Dehalococcoidia bacterium]